MDAISSFCTKVWEGYRFLSAVTRKAIQWIRSFETTPRLRRGERTGAPDTFVRRTLKVRWKMPCIELHLEQSSQQSSCTNIADIRPGYHRPRSRARANANNRKKIDT